MIVGELYPDDGRIKTGPQVKEAYLPQIVRFDHPDWNLVENMMAAKRGLSAQSARIQRTAAAVARWCASALTRSGGGCPTPSSAPA